MARRKKKVIKSNDTPKRAAIYLRVSTVHQIDKDSLPMQKQDLIGYCEYVLGIKEYIVFEDAGYSGKNTDRPSFQKMMAQVRDGLFSHVVVWKIDRISRNLLDFTTMYEELKQLGVTFVSKNEQFDTSSAMGEAMLKIILVFAELERGMASERVTATMINRATNGNWNGGRVPFGYSYIKETQTFSLNENESAVVKMIFDIYEDTKSIVRTSHQINDRGNRTRSGNLFSDVSIWKILRNPWYKGTYRYNYYLHSTREVKDASEWIMIDNHHEALIEADRFDRIQKSLEENARFRNSPGRSVQRTRINVFSGLLWCADCGAAYHASPGSLYVSGYRPSKYICSNNRKTQSCSSKSISDPIIGDFLLNYILNIINAQKEFSTIHSADDLQSVLLRGSNYKDIQNIDRDGLETLYDMLSHYTPADSVFASRPKFQPKVDPELKKLKNEHKRQERALERLNHIYLFKEASLSDQEYARQRRVIMDSLMELNEAIGMIQQDPFEKALSDHDFILKASTFIFNQKMQDKKYIYYKTLAENTDPQILKDFFRSIIDSVSLRGKNVERIVFRNGLVHTFIYKKKAGV